MSGAGKGLPHITQKLRVSSLPKNMEKQSDAVQL